MNKTYRIRTTKIGNSNGFRLPAEFYRDLPQFAADGWIEVISENSAIIKIEPQPADKEEEPEDGLMMRLFLDFALAQSLKHQDLVPYTIEMSAAARALIAGVELDDE
jgi:antitoxin PrlF